MRNTFFSVCTVIVGAFLLFFMWWNPIALLIGLGLLVVGLIDFFSSPKRE